MKIVIDIDENTYHRFINGFANEDDSILIGKLFKNGTILPKGHGRLIDADALKMDKRVCGDRYLSGSPLFVANKVIESAPTIIEDNEADNEEI